MGKNSEKKNLDHFLTLNLDHFLTLKPPNLGPLFNLTAYIYIYMLLGSFGAPQTAHFGPVLRVHLRPPQKKKTLVPQNGAYGETISRVHLRPPQGFI